MLTLPFLLLQLPVLYVDGDTPDWWLWDSHEASALERRSSSWSFVEQVPGVVETTFRIGTYLPEL